MTTSQHKSTDAVEMLATNGKSFTMFVMANPRNSRVDLLGNLSLITVWAGLPVRCNRNVAVLVMEVSDECAGTVISNYADTNATRMLLYKLQHRICTYQI